MIKINSLQRNSDYNIVMDQNVSFDGDWDKVKQIVKKVHNVKNQVHL